MYASDIRHVTGSIPGSPPGVSGGDASFKSTAPLLGQLELLVGVGVPIAAGVTSTVLVSTVLVSTVLASTVLASTVLSSTVVGGKVFVGVAAVEMWHRWLVGQREQEPLLLLGELDGLRDGEVGPWVGRVEAACVELGLDRPPPIAHDTPRSWPATRTANSVRDRTPSLR